MINKNSGLGKTVSVTIFPLSMLSILFAAQQLLQMGYGPAAIIGLASATAFTIIAIFERLLPFRNDWNQNHGDVWADILHNIFSSYASREIYKIFFIVISAPMVVYLAENYSAGSSSEGIWRSYFSGLPLVVQILLAATIAEFGNYWIHRISHEMDFFWRFHSIHHSPQRLYWLNAGRDHPVSVLLLYVAASGPLILLGVPKEVLILYYVMEAVHGLFQHCNIHVRLGPLNWLFSMTELHRWHHSKIIKEANSNYGLTLIIWDVIFATRLLPNLNGPDVIGVNYPNYPTTFWQHMLVPFRWRELTFVEPSKASFNTLDPKKP